VKRILTIAFLVFLGIPFLFLIWKYGKFLFDKDPEKSFLSPELKFTSLAIDEWNDTEMKGRLDLLLMNQLPFSFKADSVEVVLFIEKTEVLKSTEKSSFSIGANDSATLFLPLALSLEKLEKLKLNGKDSVLYRLEATFYSKMLTRKKRKYSREKYFPLFHLLDIEVGKLSFDAIKRSGADLSLKMKFRNTNTFPLRVEKLRYRLFIDNKFTGKGALPGLITFPAGKMVEMEFPLRLTYDHLWETIRAFVKKRKKIPFELKLDFDLKNSKGKSNPISISRKGTLDDLGDEK
jgi:LEA14-like dessication related protein